MDKEQFARVRSYKTPRTTSFVPRKLLCGRAMRWRGGDGVSKGEASKDGEGCSVARMQQERSDTSLLGRKGVESGNGYHTS